MGRGRGKPLVSSSLARCLQGASILQEASGPHSPCRAPHDAAAQCLHPMELPAQPSAFPIPCGSCPWEVRGQLKGGPGHLSLLPLPPQCRWLEEAALTPTGRPSLCDRTLAASGSTAAAPPPVPNPCPLSIHSLYPLLVFSPPLPAWPVPRIKSSPFERPREVAVSWPARLVGRLRLQGCQLHTKSGDLGTLWPPLLHVEEQFGQAKAL